MKKKQVHMIHVDATIVQNDGEKALFQYAIKKGIGNAGMTPEEFKKWLPDGAKIRVALVDEGFIDHVSDAVKPCGHN